MNETAVAYLRVSSQEQAKDNRYGFQRQQSSIEDFAVRHGIELEAVYKESFTGSESDRPIFSKMLAELMLNGTRSILIECMDRFSRSMISGLPFLLTLATQGVDLIDCSTGESITDALQGHPMQKAMAHQKLLYAQLEKDMIVYRLRKGRDAKSAKLGHRCEGPNSIYTKQFRVMLKRLRARGWSYQCIADHLTKKSVTTASGTEWSAPLVAGVMKGGKK